MPSPTVTMQFNAETAAFVQNILKAKDALADTAQKARDHGETIAKCGDKAAVSFEKLGKNATSQLNGIVMGLGSIGTATSVLQSIWNAHFEDMERRATRLKSTVNDLQSVVGSRGKLQEYGQFKAAIDAIPAGAMNKKERTARAAQIAGENPEATPQQVAQAVALADKGKELHVGNLDKLASTRLAIQKASGVAGGGLDGLSAGGLDDLALNVHKHIPEGLSERDLRTIEESKDKGRVLDDLISLRKAHVNSRAQQAINDMASKQLTPTEARHLKAKGHRRTEDESAELALSQLSADPEVRRQALFDNPEKYANHEHRAMLISARNNRGPSEVKGSPGELARRRAADAANIAADPEYKAVKDAERSENAADAQDNLNAVADLNSENRIRNRTTAFSQNTGINNSFIRGGVKSFNQMREAPGYDALSVLNPTTAPTAMLMQLLTSNHQEHMDKTDDHMDKVDELIDATKKAGRRTEMAKPGDDK